MDDNFSFRQFVLSQPLPPVILCIGSPKVAGDSFGPITGKLLTENFYLPTEVYGTCDSPVHALNFAAETKKIRLIHPDRKIIAVDSAVCASGKPGRIRIFPGPIYPGLAAGKNLGAVGDWSIVAATGAKNKNELFYADLKFVETLSIKAAIAIKAAFSLRKRLPSAKEYFYYNIK